jgi:hypothetical protein
MGFTALHYTDTDIIGNVPRDRAQKISRCNRVRRLTVEQDHFVSVGRLPTARCAAKKVLKRDLDEIWFHLALDNPRAADSIVDVIGGKSCLLASNPLAGRARPELAEGLRSFRSTDLCLTE